MSDSSGSILQLQPKATVLSNVNLLIVTDNANDFQAISSSLTAAHLDFTYTIISSDRLAKTKLKQKYSAILYNSAATNSSVVRPLIRKLQLLGHLYADAPIILITDSLGDEQAIKLVQSGVDGYVLRSKLERLPEVLQKTLFDFVSKQTIVTRQKDQIEQQREKIEQLEAEKQTWLLQKDRIEQQQEKIEQLEAEKQTWLLQKQSKQEHISHLSHELRSPISSILGFARMLKEQYYGALNEKQLQYAANILSSGEHLLALVKNYLDLVKIDARKQTLDLEKLAVIDICQASIFIVAEKAKEKELELTLDLDPDIDFCTADSLRLKQILINLLSNAIKFTEKGSITLKVELKKDLLYFAVIDTGMGISEKNITKLFKPFPQISSHHESTGLGLALSKKLAQLHGGDITVTSELDRGSCFTLHIPLYQ